MLRRLLARRPKHTETSAGERGINAVQMSLLHYITAASDYSFVIIASANCHYVPLSILVFASTADSGAFLLRFRFTRRYAA